MLDLADLRRRLTVGTLPRRDQEAMLAELDRLKARSEAAESLLRAMQAARAAR